MTFRSERQRSNDIFGWNMNARRYVENAAKFLPPNPACSLLPARVPELDFRPFHFWAYIFTSDSQWPLEAVISKCPLLN
jgi:hypothetical protein